ncbi:type II toxin-antitoxin system RelE/ParE family toxin [Microcoleus sp. herbarium19]|uniref:type II toxin-antitoxin system RelE/ParE family toxin n=1 Tax=unclassified Microcoleus TaxID=2642155 RepID=UPI003B1946E5
MATITHFELEDSRRLKSPARFPLRTEVTLVSHLPNVFYDLREIKNYIARDNIAAARRFVETFRNQCNLIAKSPRMGRNYE